jgi:hypothetical protein
MENDCCVDLVFFCILAIGVEPVDHEPLLFGVEKFRRLCGKINDEKPPNDTDDNSDCSLDQKDPYSV